MTAYERKVAGHAEATKRMRTDVFLGIDARRGRLLSTVGFVDDYEDVNQTHSSKSEQGLAPYLLAYSNETQNDE